MPRACFCAARCTPTGGHLYLFILPKTEKGCNFKGK
jgi:hypothetical protein